jgi:hypothetical protein
MATDPITGQTILTPRFDQQYAGFLDPTQFGQIAAGQSQAALLGQLGQQLLQAGYVPNSGSKGAISQMIQALAGGLMLKKSQDQIAGLSSQQAEMANAAYNAKHMQEQADLDKAQQREIAKQLGVKEGDLKLAHQYAPQTTADEVAKATALITPEAQKAGAVATAQLPAEEAKARAQAAATASYAGAPEAAKLGMIRQLMAQPDSPQKTAQLTSLLGEGGMQGLMLANMGGGGAGGNLTGDEFLKTLSPGMQGQVKALAEGRLAFPTGMAMRSPMAQATLQAVAQYDPTFDATNFQARNKAHTAFTNGTSMPSQSINAINTTIGHLGQLADAGDKLNNVGGIGTFLNTPLNAAVAASGDARVNNFNTLREGVAKELTRVYRGTGGSEADIQAWKEQINSSQSPEQLKGAISTAMHMLGSKLDSLKDQYKSSTGLNSTPDFLTPAAQKAMTKLANGGIDVSGVGDAAAPATPNASTTPTGVSPAAILAELQRRQAAQQQVPQAAPQSP